MRITHVEDFFYPTTGYQINALAKYGSLHGHDVTIIASDLAGRWATGSRQGGEERRIQDEAFTSRTRVTVIRVKALGEVSNRAVLSPLRLLKAIRASQPDAVLAHGNDTLTSIWIVFLLKRIGVPVAFDSHMLDIASKNRMRNIFRFLYRIFITRRLVKKGGPLYAVDPSCRDYMTRSFGIPFQRIRILPLGFDPEVFYPFSPDRRHSIRASLGIRDDDFSIIYTGKISEDKKVHVLLDALGALEDSVPSGCVLILVGAGQGDYFGRCIEQVQTLKCRVVRLDTQPVEALCPLYNAADIAVWPGASSLSMLDAMACGRPVVAEDIEINRSRLCHGNGFVFKPNDAADLAGTLLRFRALPDDAKAEMGRSAQVFVSADFSYESISRQFERDLEETIAHA